MDIASLSLVGYIVYPFLRFSDTRNIVYLYLGIGMIATDYTTKLLKYATKNMGQFFVRPNFATDCDICTKNGECGGQPGFPSGQVSVMVMFTTFTHLYKKDMSSTIFNSVISVLVAWSRQNQQCQNEFQIMGGAFVGFINGFLLHTLMIRIQMV
jgi:hypothetical protein